MTKQSKKAISLAPLSFEEAVTDILKVKPGPKPERESHEKKPKAKKQAGSNRSK